MQGQLAAFVFRALAMLVLTLPIQVAWAAEAKPGD